MPYVAALAVAFTIPRYAAYVWPDAGTIKGQSLQLVLTWIGCASAFGLWLFCRRSPTRDGWLRAFLLAMSVAWVLSMLLGRVHGDLFDYTAWLYVPIMLMLLLRTPTASEAWRGLMLIGWIIAAILVATLLLERLGVLDVFYTSDYVRGYEAREYWLPLADAFGLEGRWPGPFRGAVDTAMMGGLLIVLAAAHWRARNWILLVLGVLVMVLSASRVAMMAVVISLVLLVIFSRKGPLARVPSWVRWSALAGLGVALGAFLVRIGPGLNGRENIWPEFVALWQTSPVIGAGTTGIADYSKLTALSGHAHNFVLDVLVRYGVVGAVVQFAALGIGVWIVGRAAGRGNAGPAALFAFYIVTSVTDVRNDWLHPSLNLLILLLAVVAATERSPSAPGSTQDQESSEGALAG